MHIDLLGGVLQAKEANSKDGGGAVAIRQPYLRVVGLENDIEGDAHNSPTFRYELASLCIFCCPAIMHCCSAAQPSTPTPSLKHRHLASN